MIDLGTLGEPTTIDSVGRVYALISDASGHHVLRWDRGTVADLGVIPSGFFSLSRNGLFGAGALCPHEGNTCTLYSFHDGSVTPLDAGDPAYGSESGIAFVGDDGTIIGGVQDASQSGSGNATAVLWQHGVRHELESIDPLHPFITARLMNASGQVIGVGTDAQRYQQRPYLWENGRARDLGGLFDQLCSAHPTQACGAVSWWINAAGDIVGHSIDPTGLERAVIWRGGGTVQDLGVFPGQSTFAQYINDQGDIWGFGGPNHWWAIIGGVQYDPGAPAGVPSHPYRMNQRGEIVGDVGDRAAGLSPHAFVWRKGKMLDLGVGPAGSQWAGALSINDRGDVLAVYVNAQGQQGVVLWRVSN